MITDRDLRTAESYQRAVRREDRAWQKFVKEFRNTPVKRVYHN